MRIIFATLISLMLLSGAPQVHGQYSLVKKVNVETQDGLVFGASVEQQSIDYGQNVIVHYRVRNNSRSVVYLVHQTSPEFDTAGGVILIQAPIPAPVGHGGYDYSFSRIEPAGEYKGRISIPSKQYDKADIWPIEIAFGYVRNVTGLNRRLRDGEDPAGLRGLLSSRIRTVVAGSLSVEVKEGRR